jgi:hypothetical protein
MISRGTPKDILQKRDWGTLVQGEEEGGGERKYFLILKHELRYKSVFLVCLSSFSINGIEKRTTRAMAPAVSRRSVSFEAQVETQAGP